MQLTPSLIKHRALKTYEGSTYISIHF